MAAARPVQEQSSQARRLTILDLPEETHREIFNHCNMSELVCLALVSKHFHHIASEIMYRTLHFSLPYHGGKLCEDTLAACLNTLTTSEYNYARHLRELFIDASYGTGPEADRTIAPYVYSESCGKFLNTLLLLTLRKTKGLEKFYWDVRIELGRPVFRVLHQIHTLSDVQIRLQKGPSIHESTPLLPLSHSSSLSTFVPHSTSTGMPIESIIHLPSFQHMPFQPPHPNTFVPITTASAFYNPFTPAPSPISAQLKTQSRPSKVPKRGLSRAEPPTISGFKNLKVLSVLDIDALDVITEIKPCLRNSAGTIIELSLSFSEALASKARKPPPDTDSEESDFDDIEFNVPLSTTLADAEPATTNQAHASSKLLYAQEEKYRQDSALSRIFDLEPFLLRQQPKQPKVSANGSASNASLASDSNNSRVEFANAVRDMTVQLLNSTVSGSNIGDHSKMLDTIESAAKKYIDSEDAKSAQEKKGDQVKEHGQSKKGNALNTTDTIVSESGLDGSAADESDKEVSLFRDGDTVTKLKSKGADVSPEDIDVEEPEGQLVLEEGSCDRDLEDSSDKEADPELPTDSVLASASASGQAQSSPQGQSSTWGSQQDPLAEPISDDSINKLAADISAQKANFKALLDRLATLEKRALTSRKGLEAMYSMRDDAEPQVLLEMERREQALHKDIRRLFQETRTVAAEVRDIEASKPASKTGRQTPQEASAAETPDAANSAQAHSNRRLVDKYVRSTRGIVLEELNLSLIPVTASVLSKAIDLHTLVRITLLNVGPQAPIWSLFSRENRARPLALRSIFTDNVSTVFLVFVAQLEEVHTLLLLERDANHKPESLAPKTTTTISDIRHIVLKKHARHLKKLMIKNAASQDWDVDEATIKLLGRRARNLAELAVSMKMQTIHDLILQLPNFIGLVALNIIRLRNDDTCVWVTQEIKRFILDTVAHYPHLILEWLAIDNNLSVERIMRVSPKKMVEAKKQKKTKKAGQSKGKEKATNTQWSGSFETNGISKGSAASKIYDNSDDSDSSSSDGSAPYKQAKLQLEHCHVDDTWDISIFDRVVRVGRL